MKILFFTIGTRVYPSSRTRVYGYLPYLEREGISFKVINLVSQKQTEYNLRMEGVDIISRICEKAYNLKNALKVMLLCRRYDIVFLQKILLPRILLNMIKVFNRRIVFDFDDAVYISSAKDRGRFINTVRSSRLVIASTEFLAKEARRYNDNVTTIPTSIDIDKYKMKKRDTPNCKYTIVWIGTPAAVKYLDRIKDVFIKIVGSYKDKVKIRLIGADRFATGDPLTDSHIELVKWAEDTEADEISSGDTGIMPMQSDNWSIGKAGYKLIQYMGASLPVLSDANVVSEKIIDDGTDGFLLKDDTGWFDKFSLLIENRKMGEKMGAAGRKKAEREYSYKSNFRRFYDCLKNCM